MNNTPRQYKIAELKKFAQQIGCTCILHSRGLYNEHTPYAWICACGKQYTATIYALRHGQKCQSCGNRKTLQTAPVSSMKRNRNIRAKIVRNSTPRVQAEARTLTTFNTIITGGDLALDDYDLTAIAILKTLKIRG